MTIYTAHSGRNEAFILGSMPEKEMTKSIHNALLEALQRGMPEEASLLFIEHTAQRCSVMIAGEVSASYLVSTSKYGLGNKANSYCTPTGLHRIAERYGDKAPLGAIFRSRIMTGQVIPESEWYGSSEDDLILSRILRLSGTEPGINVGGECDSYDRYIYLHGTNQEQLIGTPASNGCIRMRNSDIAELFDTLRAHDQVYFLIQ